MRTLLICHEDARLDREALAGWLASFSTLAGILVIRETRRQRWRRVRRQIARVGLARFADVLAFRAYHQLMWAERDRHWEGETLAQLKVAYPRDPSTPALVVSSPNSREAAAFIAGREPDMAIARCKTLLKESVFTIPRLGTYVFHPGICPEYRNSHGCFWALANHDTGNVGMTLLRIDRGVDTGPIYGHYRVTADPAGESHVVVQHRAVFDHLDAIRDTLTAIARGAARPIDVSGRPSASWGQPWLTAYLRGLRAPAQQTESCPR